MPAQSKAVSYKVKADGPTLLSYKLLEVLEADLLLKSVKDLRVLHLLLESSILLIRTSVRLDKAARKYWSLPSRLFLYTQSSPLEANA